MCAFQRCHKQCTSSRDCSTGLLCVSSAGSGVCQLPDESTCHEDGDCAPGQVCASGACRGGCRDDSACLSSQRCVDSACQDVATDGGIGSGGSSGSDASSGSGGGAGTDGGADAGPPACRLASLDTDCPSNECRQATTCAVDGSCVYQPLAKVTCGTCDLGMPDCSDPAHFACQDVEVLGLSGAEVNCDSTSADSTFVFLDATYTGPSPNGSRTAPFVALGDALLAASRPGRGATTVVIAGSPVYTDPLVLPDGVSIRGGYTATDAAGTFTGAWHRDLSRRPIWNIPASAMADHALVGLKAAHIHRTTIVADVTVVTQPILGASADTGATNIGLLAIDAPGLRLFDVTVTAGAAQDGAQGEAGAVGPDGPGVAGADGKANLTQGTPTLAALDGAHNSGCDSSRTQGGASGAINGAGEPGGAAPSGAAGGTTSSPAAPGAAVTTIGTTGNAGVSGASVDPVTGVLTLKGSGDTGAQGDSGFGGGGGYSSVNGIGSNLYYFALGGSGGAGGCGGLGGLGGLPGGWSIGVLAVSSPGLVIRGGAITASNGGNGGAGGDGGPGGPGGRGGNGAIIQTQPNPPEVQSGGGGKGSAGGQGGTGGVGAGGSSIAVYCAATTVSPDQTAFKVGKTGSGGSGKRAVATLGC